MKKKQFSSVIQRLFAGIFVCALFLSVLCIPSNAHPANEAVYNIVIRNGRVLDGAGNPWIPADVAIKVGRFVGIGLIIGKGKREIYAAAENMFHRVG